METATLGSCAVASATEIVGICAAADSISQRDEPVDIAAQSPASGLIDSAVECCISAAAVGAAGNVPDEIKPAAGVGNSTTSTAALTEASTAAAAGAPGSIGAPRQSRFLGIYVIPSSISDHIPIVSDISFALD